MILELEEVTKKYPKRTGLFQKNISFTAVHSVSFSIAKGESVGLVGESGCGKSTLAKLIMNIDFPTSGCIRVNKKLIEKKTHDRAFYKQIQLVLQDSSSSLYPGMCVREIIEEPVRNFFGLKGKNSLASVKRLLELVGLDDSFLRRFPHELSGGQKQRICIAKALAVQPDLIIFDEAVASLDPPAQREIIHMLKNIQKQKGLSYLFITHDLRSAHQLCSRIMVMYQGKIVDTVKADNHQPPVHPYARLLFQSLLKKEAKQLM
ncbi:ABC transporter ATP-binding protein [Domibacillus robiginosus]|uniref:ABC transporter ATP-binding protein n=1 Tax=Domibacillus robiginosus TaxID=1071054 RepID=UPI00067C5073|nr:dipeptide/oligopeptide/nickel ABC transporter ATP-binding protein [Domibacillus robiginosus]